MGKTGTKKNEKSINTPPSSTRPPSILASVNKNVRIAKSTSKSPSNNLSSMKPPSGGVGMKPPSAGVGVKPQSPGAGVKLQSPGAGMKPQSLGAGVKPQSPGAGVKPQSPGAGMKPQSPSAVVKSASAGAGMKPQSPGTRVKPPLAGAGIKLSSPGAGFKNANVVNPVPKTPPNSLGKETGKQPDGFADSVEICEVPKEPLSALKPKSSVSCINKGAGIANSPSKTPSNNTSSIGAPSGGAENKASSPGAGFKDANSTPEASSNALANEIDKQLGGFYGSVELRDALKEAQVHMDAVVAVLHRVCEFVRTPFVRMEVEQFLHNLTTLKKVFVCVLNRMEIPDSDEFLDAVIAKSLADCQVNCSQNQLVSNPRK